MTDFIPIRQILDRWREDPDLAAGIDEERDALLIEQERERMRALFTLFGTLVQEDGVSRQESLRSGAALLTDDPSLFAAFPVDPEELLDEAIDRAWDTVLEAADPMTGDVPAEVCEDESLLAIAEHDADLQQVLRDRRIDLGQPGFDMQAVIDRVMAAFPSFSPQRLGGEENSWSEIVELPDDAGITPELMSVRDFRGNQETGVGLEPGDIRLTYAEDPEGQYRLEMARRYHGNGQYAVILRLFWPGTMHLMADSRDQWSVSATLGDTPLAVVASRRDEAYQLKDWVAEGDLGKIVFEVTFTLGDGS